MTNISLYFKIHKPFILKEYKVFEVGNSQNYFDEEKNKYIIQKSGEKYIKNNQFLLKLIKQYPDTFKVSFAISGTTLELMEKYAKNVLESFQELAKTGNVEFLGETYYHSLSFLYSKEEYIEQIKLHTKAIQKYFNQTPQTYRNTRLKYCNDVAQAVKEANLNNIFIEHSKKILNFRNQNHIYSAPNEVKLFTKNSNISKQFKENISNHNENFDLVNTINQSKEDEIINICFKYNMLNTSFAQNYFEKTITLILDNKNNQFLSTTEIKNKFEVKEILDVDQRVEMITKQTQELWFGNKMQITLSNKLYSMEKEVKKSKDPELLDSWRKFTTSNNFYFLTTKNHDASDYHLKIKNIYESPYEAYTYFINALQDLILNVEKKIRLLEPTTIPELANEDN